MCGAGLIESGVIQNFWLQGESLIREGGLIELLWYAMLLELRRKRKRRVEFVY